MARFECVACGADLLLRPEDEFPRDMYFAAGHRNSLSFAAPTGQDEKDHPGAGAGPGPGPVGQEKDHKGPGPGAGAGAGALTFQEQEQCGCFFDSLDSWGISRNREVVGCRACGAHLGELLEDGPARDGTRGHSGFGPSQVVPRVRRLRLRSKRVIRVEQPKDRPGGGEEHGSQKVG